MFSRPLSLRAAALALAIAPGLASAGVRPAPGGTATVALPGEARAPDPVLAEDAADLFLSRATSAPLLGRDAQGRLAPGVLAEIPASCDGGRTFRLRVREGLATASGAPLGAAEVGAGIARLLARTPASPHAWAALPIAGADAVLAGRAAWAEGIRVVSERELELSLSFRLPELPELLAALPLAVPGVGPFVAAAAPARGAPAALRANPAAAGGRPFLDALALRAADARTAARLLARGEAQLVLRPEAAGGTAGPALPALRVTVAALGPGLGAGAARVRAALASVDRSVLARRFVRGAAVPLATLVPPALLAASPADSARATGGAADPGRVRILVRRDATDPRAISDRLQVTLFDRGITAAVEAVERERFAARLAAGEYEIALVEVRVLATRPALAAGQIVFAARGAAASRRAMAALAGLEGGEAAAAAERVARELDLVPLVATATRASAGPGLGGIAAGPDGLVDPGALWRLAVEADAP
jgi:peptide/nickel transport system substrate-binding protein